MLKNSRLHIQVVCEALLLLTVTLGILAYFSHKALHEEALRNAEQMLKGTVQDIDNILMSVEQSTGNVYFDLKEHLDDPDRMYTYSRELVKSNPNIVGCAICFKPGYYPGKDLFMAVHSITGSDSKTDLVTSDTFTNHPYTEQMWYAKPVNKGWVGWTDPLKGSDTEDEPLVTFCLPFTDHSGEYVGVIAVDVSLNQLSKIILAAKPSENGYSVLLARNGSYIVHPDSEKLTGPLTFSHKRSVDDTETEAAKAMLAGEHGMKKFRRGDSDWVVFYQPLERVGWEGHFKGKEDWSVGVVFPENDIFGRHNILLYQVVVIAVIGMLLFILLCNWIIRRQLKPLIQLTSSAHRVAEGNYNEMLPTSDRLDEIGLLQNRFKQMQQSLQKQVTEQEEETLRLLQHGDMLRAAYDKTVESDAMKTSFLHYMTNQMVEPAQSVDNNVTALCNNYYYLSNEELNGRADIIEQKSQAVLDLTNHLAHFTEEDTGKEAAHD